MAGLIGVLPNCRILLTIICAHILQALLAHPVLDKDDIVTQLGFISHLHNSSRLPTENEAVLYLEYVDKLYSSQCNIQAESWWKYATNITDENEDNLVSALYGFTEFEASVQQEIFENFPNWPQFEDPKVRRQFKYYSELGPADMDPADVNQMNTIEIEMESAYSSSKVCEYGSKDEESCVKLNLDPGLQTKLKTSKDFDELEYYWTSWHDTMARAVPVSHYKAFVDLQNEYARANNHSNIAEMWVVPYHDGSVDFSLATFRKQILDMWAELQPYYEKLHAYIRMKLRKDKTFAEKIGKDGYMPANILGDMWAQDWTALGNATKPFPNTATFDATEAMKTAGYTPKIMFEKANEFFIGLGLLGVTQTFTQKSMIEKPEGREVLCQAAAEDMCLGKGSTDFRIIMCTKVNQDDFIRIHHELGHIQYFMQYTDQPFIFRNGANPGFHEAIGDTLALAVFTPTHLKCHLGLDIGFPIDCSPGSEMKQNISAGDINHLYTLALDMFPFLPFAVSVETWRWGVFEGSIPISEYNTKWWEIRQNNQGIVPPHPRPSMEGLDAAAKFHIVANQEYARYFISRILQFQIFEALCVKAGKFNRTDERSKPLHHCDLSGNGEVGSIFGNMMKLGFSEPWPIALKELTGSDKLTVEPLVDFFKPLFAYLETELKTNGEIVGFGKSRVHS